MCSSDLLAEMGGKLSLDDEPADEAPEGEQPEGQETGESR